MSRRARASAADAEETPEAAEAGDGSHLSNQRRAWADVARRRAAHLARADADNRMDGRRRSKRQKADPQHPDEVVSKISLSMPGVRSRRGTAASQGGEAKDKGGDDDDDDDDDQDAGEVDQQWHGPWTVAREMHDAKEAAAERRQKQLEEAERAEAVVKEFSVAWTPRKGPRRRKRAAKRIPALLELCVQTLVEYSDSMVGLGSVPSELRARFALALCQRNKLNDLTLGIVIEPHVAEIVIPNAAPLEEKSLVDKIAALEGDAVETIKLVNAGRCVSDAGGVPRLLGRKFASSLRHLALDGCYKLSDDGCAALLHQLRNLETLSLKYNHRIGSKTCDALKSADLRKSLRLLCLNFCPMIRPEDLVSIVEHLPALSNLEMAGREDLDDGTLGKMLERVGSRLKALDVSKCPSLTGKSIRRLRDLAPELEQLNLSSCYGLEDDDIRVLFRVQEEPPAANDDEAPSDGSEKRAVEGTGNPLTKLQVLMMKEVDVLDETVEALVEAIGHSVRTLSFDSCDELTDRSMVAIGRGCHLALRDLNMSFCRKITNEGCGYLADNCAGLRLLRLWGCTQISDKFLSGHRNLALVVEGNYEQSFHSPKLKSA